MGDVKYTDPSKIVDVVADETAPPNRSVSGYGGKIPTRYRVRIEGSKGKRWHRVYVMQWSNSGTAYVLIGGERYVIDQATEARMNEGN